jgi:glycosyltransferase involved in cell wall biosynthesis
MTRISVVIPTRNRPHYLREAIASVLAQTHAPHEIIVVDDGEGARDAVSHVHPCVKVVSSHQGGPVRARNVGDAEATGDVIACLDDDDWLTDTRYFATAAAAFAAGAVYCYADGIMAFEDGRPSLPFAFHADRETLTRDNTILVSAIIYRRSLHDELGMFDESLPFYWDWDWHLRVARAGHELTHIRKPVVAIRVHRQNLSGESLVARRRANLDEFSTKHGLAPIPLKNHLDIATQAPDLPDAPRADR